MSTVDPVVPNYPSTSRALGRKYSPGGSIGDPQSIVRALSFLPPPAALPTLRPPTLDNTILPLLAYDQARANRGLNPLTARQSAAALQTLRTGQPHTKPRRQGFFSSVLSDLRAVVGTIPKLPQLAYQEIQKIPDIPEEVARAQQMAGGNPLELLGNLAAVPVARLIPGSFVANQLLGDPRTGAQGAAGLVAHPLFTALDLLPVASKAAGSTAVAKAARAEVDAANAARLAQAIEITGQPGTARLARQPSPLRTVLTRKLDEAGNLAPGRVGHVTGPAFEALYSTPTGRAFQATFKERDLPRLESRYTSTLREMAEPGQVARPTTIGRTNVAKEVALLDHADRIKSLLDEAGVDDARADYLFRVADDPQSVGALIPEQAPGLTPAESAVLTEIREFQSARARVTEGDLTQSIDIDGRSEVYDLPTAGRINVARTRTDRAREHVEAREAINDPSVLGDTPEAVRDTILAKLDDVAERRASGALPNSTADLLTRSWMAALDEAGWTWVDEGGGVLDDLSADAQWANARLQQVARPTVPDLITALRPLARRYPTIPRLIDHLQAGRWSAARRDLDAFASTRAGGTLVDDLPFDIDGLKAELTRQRQRSRTLDASSKYTPRLLQRLERNQAKVEGQAVPARFTSTVQRTAEEAITGRVKELYSGTPDLDRMIDMAANRVYDAIHLLPEAEVRALQREARASWQALRDAGLNPIFVSRVTPEQAARLPFVRVSDSPITPAAAKARMWDATPHQTDLGIAVTSDALQLLQRRGVDAFLNEFTTVYGKTRAQLVEELYPRAVARAEGSRISAQAHLARLIDERWMPWDASKYTSKRTSSALPVTTREQTMVPRVMGENMDRLFTPPLPKLTAFFDPVMKVFRTAVLPLAPRWHIYNAVGGATMTAVSDLAAFRYLPETIAEMWQVKKATGRARAPHVEGQPPSGALTIPPEHRAWDAAVRARSPLKDRLAASHNYAAGRTLAQWWEQARASRLAKIPDAARRGVEASYNANQMVDDMYRAMVGTSARKRALRRGMSEQMAEAESVAAIRRVFQSWDEMTPMERSIMRAVVPFYGWSSHILRFASKYPFDHPIRTSVLASFARAELTDASTGLPEYIRDMVLIGDVRANGVVRGLNVGPFNPFRDLGSFFTTAGFLGNLNPVLTGVLESVGVNVAQGGPSLYPEVRYDPETGRLVADPKGNLASNIIGNVLPQAELFTALIGRNESFAATLQRDPEAAGRQLLSNMGIPVLFRDINIGEQLIRSELARMEDQDNARKEALATGNLSILEDFPSMAAYAEQIRALEDAGLLDQLRPAAQDATGAAATMSPGERAEAGLPSGAGLAYAAQAALLGS